MAILVVCVSVANAQATMKTYCFIGAIPNPVGVGQEVLFHVGITRELSTVAMGWEGLSITIRKPDGTTETISGIRTDATGGTGVVYVPKVAGNHTVQAHFPQQVTVAGVKTSPGVPAGTVMLASDSEPLTLVVLEEPVPEYPWLPLPTEFWTRPINAQLREWRLIAGNWPGAPVNGFVTCNDDAPEAPHILWRKQTQMGGLVGGEIVGINGPGVGFEIGAAYEQKFGAPVILAGILFYNRYEERGGTNVEQEVVAVDLHTGEELWVRNWNNTRLDVGQIFYWESYNYMGAFAYLWEVTGSTWRAFEAFTGRWVYTMTNVPATISTYGGGLGSNSWFGPRGEIYAYTVNLTAGWMTLWNSSRVVSNEGSWRPHGNTYNCTWDAPRRGGYEWNITIPKGLLGSVRGVVLDDRVVGSNVNTTTVDIWAFSLKKGQEGTLLFRNTWSAPADWSEGNQTISWLATSLEDNVGIVRSKELRRYWGFDLQTGKHLWVTEPEHYLQYLGTDYAIAYGKFYTTYMSGIVYCYDIQTGERLWAHEVRDPYNEILWSGNWPMRIQFITDGKIYLCEAEHSPNQPLPRGAPYVCLNATTGEEIWRIPITYYYRTNTLIGDNIIAVHNLYENSIYAIGKGPSATTVTTSPKVIANGQAVVIEGTVMDVSPGTKEPGIAMRFPNGVPAVADENMSEWMQYVYMQFPRPANVKGVWVTFDVIGPDGKWEHVGGTHTDDSGMFSIPWKPPAEGLWTIVITFPGSKSYWPSYARTTILVEPAPPAIEIPEAPQPIDYMPILTGLAVAIIVVAILVVYDIISVRKMRK
jgi:hypothetical protein